VKTRWEEVHHGRKVESGSEEERVKQVMVDRSLNLISRQPLWTLGLNLLN
jgi:hypothetical protein